MVTPDDFVFSIGNIFFYRGNKLIFTKEDFDSYFELGLTTDHIHTYAFMYLCDDDYTAFNPPKYSSTVH